MDWFGVVMLAAASAILLCSQTGCSESESERWDPFVTTYPTPPGSRGSAYYSVSANNIPIFAHNQREVSYAHFGMAGPVEVRVTLAEPVRTFDVSPHSYNVEATAVGDSIVFRLDAPRQLLLHRVNDAEEVLCILADPPEDEVPTLGEDGVTDIRDWLSDTRDGADDTGAIQRALDETPEGGTLYVPPGRYTFTDLAVPPQRSVYLAPGAVLQVSEDRDGQIDCSAASGGKLFGRGTIDGRGYIHRHRVRGEEEGRALLACRQGSSSHDFSIEGLVIRNAPIWTAILFDTMRWRIANVKIINDCQYVNRDGIDPHNSRRLTIEGCFMYVSDDPIAYSTTRPGLNLGSVMKNCVFYNGGTGTFVRIGPWVGDGTTNLLIENVDCIHGGTDHALGLYLGGAASDLQFRNIRMEDPGAGLIGISTLWQDYYAGRKSGSLRGALFEAICSQDWGKNGVAFQAPSSDNSVQDVTFRGLVVSGQKVVDAADPHISFGPHVKDIVFEADGPTEVEVVASRPVGAPGGAAEVTFTRKGDTSAPLEVRLRVGGTAAEGHDYEELPRVVTIPSGAGEVRIPVARKQPLSSVRTVLLTLEHDTEYVVGPRYHAQLTL